MRTLLVVATLCALVCVASALAAADAKKKYDSEMGLDKFVDNLIKDAQDTHKKHESKTTVMENANTLTHQNVDKSVDPEQMLKKTAEEGNKVQREDASKQLNEDQQKKLEETSKKEVKRLKDNIREQQDKTQAEQDKKTVDEQRNKLAEVQQKKSAEQKNKEIVAAAAARTNKEKQAAYAEMDAKRIEEESSKRALEQQSKQQILEVQQKAAADRARAAAEVEAKKKEEERAKEEKVKAAQREQNAKNQQEQQEKQRKANALGRTCNCINQGVDFNRNDNWNECPDGYLMTGLYRGDSHALNSLSQFRCCKPCQEDGTTVLQVAGCSQADWVRSFDSTGWSTCPDNTYMRGLYKSSCNLIYCIEYARCCQIMESKGNANCNQKNEWGHSFDRAGFSVTDDNKFMQGLYRSGDHWLFNIEWPKQCNFFSFNL